MKKLLFTLALATLSLTSCSTDEPLVENNPIEEPTDNTQIRNLNIGWISDCSVKRSIIVNGIEQDYGVSYGDSYAYNVPFNVGDVVQVVIRNNGQCNSNVWQNRVTISKWNDNGGSTILLQNNCNSCYVLTSDTFIVQ